MEASKSLGPLRGGKGEGNLFRGIFQFLEQKRGGERSTSLVLAQVRKRRDSTGLNAGLKSTFYIRRRRRTPPHAAMDQKEKKRDERQSGVLWLLREGEPAQLVRLAGKKKKDPDCGAYGPGGKQGGGKRGGTFATPSKGKGKGVAQRRLCKWR